ncbi:hypothetical protein D3OALGA1CA_2221 [Olavius algarvensis associated proteobacterium Delta 3]|nr:hypothetical protein D3OALGA1CA_2221 [Olavius algarvensis associated proteobacterium Delta 3]CAB5166013.1 hypothetical protein D3OALGB2SA_5762 [Olavius algarvensis associated proteobacterium Delta 3]
MQENSDHPQSSSRQRPRRSQSKPAFNRSVIWIALTAVLVVIAVVWGFRILQVTRFANDLARDMAACHHAEQEVTFRVGAFQELADAMPQLTFSPVFPQRIEKLQPVFIGAQYCNILERTAVQIRLKNAGGSSYSLFQVRLIPADPELKDSELIGEGVLVRLWQQDGLLMGLVGTR